MITSTPVGSWTWENLGPSVSDELASRCLHTVLSVREILVRNGVSEAGGRASVSVRGEGRNSVFVDKELRRVGSSPEEVEKQLRELLLSARESSPGGVGFISLLLSCPGFWWEGGERCRAEKMFTIDVSSTVGAAETVTLSTYSDVWLNRDLRGREQPAVQQENAPLLSRVLAEISEFTQDEPEPGDSTSFAEPTGTGFEDTPDDDPELLDFWGIYEVPDRIRALRNRLPQGTSEYEPVAEGPVKYVPVGFDGEVLGYLWASEFSDAAGYEPRNAAGDAAFEAGAYWLRGLSEAKQQEARPIDALRALARLEGDPHAGRALDEALSEAGSLDDLQETSGRW